MHEVSVMTSIVDAVLKELEKHQVSGVEEVELVLGELTRLGKDQMEFAYEVVTCGTPLEGSKLNIIEERIEVRCAFCGHSGEAERLEEDGFHHSIPVLSCPSCSQALEVLSGRSCAVRSVKVLE